MNVVWSLPVRGESLASTRGDLVRARCLIDALRDDGHHVRVVADDATRAARTRVTAYRGLVRPLLPAPVATVARDLVRVGHARAHGRRVAEAAFQEEAELIIETQVHFAGSGALASRLAGLPLLLDDCSPWTEERTLGAALPGLARRVFRTQAQVAAALTVSSSQIRDRLIGDGAPADRVHVVPNGVDPEAYLAVDRTTARHRLGFGDEIVVGFLGSFQPWHRVQLLLEALGRSSSSRLHLLLIGDGPERGRVQARAEELGLHDRITWPGPLFGPDLAAALVACDIGALPASNDYGQPMKLLDYAAAGLAIVAPDLPPVRDMIEPDVTGLLIPAEDPAAMARALSTLADAPVARARLGRTARDRLAVRTTWRDRARALLRTVGPAGATTHLNGASERTRTKRTPLSSRARRGAAPSRA